MATSKKTKKNTKSNPEHLSLFTDYDIGLFKAGKHYQLYNLLGCHIIDSKTVKGAYFSVWAPNAEYVSVIGNFNGWNRSENPMHVRWDSSGIWEVFIPGFRQFEFYKYFIQGHNGFSVEKADPFAFHCETPPRTASVSYHTVYGWHDEDWMSSRNNSLEKPMNVYEVHLGSWRRGADGNFLTYRDIAEQLPDYCSYMGFTHVEFMPVMEHPFYGSWGYQLTGYFAPTSRFGLPEDFMHLVDELHRKNIGVILDWVPSHFPGDEHGLAYFDGTHLFEYADPFKGFHPDWKSYIFNYDRNEVRSFLISNALFWLDKYHIDGLRVDAVASMLYLDYSRNHGEWRSNIHGGRENLEAVSFLQEFNEAVHRHHPDTITIAEESTAWPGVTRKVSEGGLGFDLKWMMGWMHDTLNYFQKDPVFRRYDQDMITFSMHYFFSEKFMLPLSHDEVVYGKRSLINKMPGDEWQQFANLRLLFSYMYLHPGSKIIFMGGEFGQRHEWRHDFSLDWHENEFPAHRGIQSVVKELNRISTDEKCLYESNYAWSGFRWIDMQDRGNSVISWVRIGKSEEDQLVIVANFTPVVRENYRIGVPLRGHYIELFNSDDKMFGGSNVHNPRVIRTAPVARHNQQQSLSLTLPPLAIIALKNIKLSGYRSQSGA